MKYKIVLKEEDYYPYKVLKGDGYIFFTWKKISEFKTLMQAEEHIQYLINKIKEFNKVENKIFKVD